MTQIRSILTRANALAAAGILVFAAVLAAIPASQANALSLANRSLNVTSTVASDDNTAPDGSTYTYGGGGGDEIPAGDSRNGTKVGHVYQFDTPTAGDIEGFTFEICTSAFGYVGAGACSAPSGFDASTLSGQTIDVGGVTYDILVEGTDSNFITLTDDTGTGITVTADQTVTVDFTTILSESVYFVNPDTAYRTGGTNGTYFSHVSTFSDDTVAALAFDDTDPEPDGVVDDGTVTNNVTTSISIYTRVQETLNFSVEGDDPGDNNPGAPSAANWNGGTCDPLGVETDATGSIVMGDSNNALASDTAYFGKSYFRLATNASSGTDVFYSGTTLTSGADTIDPIGGSATASTTGTEQFGLAFDSSDGGGVVWEGEATSLDPVDAYGNVTGGYAFVAGPTTPVLLAEAGGIVDCETAAVEYVANIAVDTEAGIYTTKVNYIAVPEY